MKKMFKKMVEDMEKMSQSMGENFTEKSSENEENKLPDYDDTREEEEEEIVLDPVTLHGTHYTIEEFEDTVEEYVEDWIADQEAEGELVSQQDIDNIYREYRRMIYVQWNHADESLVHRWEHVNSLKHTGVSQFGAAVNDTDNPLLEPIHGVSLEEYSAMCAAMASGLDENKVIQAFGIDQAIFDEINVIWPKRMAEDSSFSVTNLFSQYFASGASHPKLQQLQSANVPASNPENLQKMRSDRYFYEELNAARNAAYQYGLDGAAWIETNFGITLGDFQSVATDWAMRGAGNWDMEEMQHFMRFQDEKFKEYADRFAAEMGGNIADDVDF
ncbi:MAG: hypothetical protein Q4G08_11075 [Capnocytophaga sp.]|nr:hypothetical protein [Capnocytophaga sp.]